MTGSSGLAFWLSYVESRGGLWESAGDAAIVMIPPQLQTRLELPEEFAVTQHPDVAREDGVALVAPGHPLLTAAAEDVLSADDAGVLTLGSPASQPPDDHRLLARARDQFPVDHGRIDASGPAERRLRQVLRVGVLVTYTASADEVFHERAECWLDVPSRQELPEQAVRGMRRFIGDGPAAGGPPDLAALHAAIARAHRLLDQRFSERCSVLAGGSARDAAGAELGRAKTYYAEALASLARRQANRPYRLYLLLVPVLRLPVDVLRGARRFPLTLDWMLPAGAFAPVSCPGCGADTARSPLAAAKTRLGCASCLSGPAAEPHAPPVAGGTGGPARGRSGESPAPAVAGVTGALDRSRSGESPVPAVAGVTGGLDRSRSGNSGLGSSGVSRGKGKAAGPPGAPAPGRGGGPPPGRAAPPERRPADRRPVPPAAKKKQISAQAVSKAGEKLAMEFWSVTAHDNLRALRRLCAADSPAAAVIRLYGTAGPAVAAGLEPGERPESLTSASAVYGEGELAGTGGYLSTGRGDYTYLLRWHPQTRLVSEVLPFGSWVSARLPSARWLRSPGAARMFGGRPEPDAELDPVAIRLWRKALATNGVPLALRCLAAWWRIGDGPELAAGHRPSVLAAAIHRMTASRAAEAGSTHDAIAGLYGVTPSDTRAITPLLQARLQLTTTQPWQRADERPSCRPTG